MLFTDKARIYVEAGTGGDGASSFRREKFVAHGGPDGGNGGRGGSVWLVVDDNLNTLVDFRYKRKFVASRGGNGGAKNCTGHKADDVEVKVPIGTVVIDDATGVVLADLSHKGDRYLAAKGGRGGKGNACYVTSTKQGVTFAEKGEPGTKGWLRLELKLLADVGMVGYPSVGKSSIVARVSAARPEVAAYHFTTLSPVLGVVRLNPENSFVLADLPGLIEGASKGVGLGHDFLRHIERTRVIMHVVDCSGCEGRNPVEDFKKINEELALYSDKLAKRPQLVVANKMDLPGAEENYPALEAYVKSQGYPIMKVSAATGQGLREVMYKAYEMVQKAPHEPEFLEIGHVKEVDPDSFEVLTDTEDADFEVKGKNIERLVAMTNFDNEEALYRFQLIWRRLGIEKALKDKGIEEGQSVKIGDMIFDYHDQY
ncbi:MAG: GTPase ObgE [Acidaminococcus sp.]|jgi:GTP-binding protein|nr:GTPase ObgE [Acidaminococcus sp.]MCI2100618.1 GTPase ObgE [Acidaminococcus sp.]MCI2114939.1 GTPase ObgE [Acidaminococcus sp.]MCI2116965.1 GTPase ObgE [Acidaminococcus sp.]